MLQVQVQWRLLHDFKVIATGTQSQIKKAWKAFVDSRNNVYFLMKQVLHDGKVVRTINCDYSKRFGKKFKEKHQRELEAMCNPWFNI